MDYVGIDYNLTTAKTSLKGGRKKGMITKRTLKINDKKMGDKYFLEYIDDDTGGRIKQVPLDEAEYKDETTRILIEGHMRKNPGVTCSESLLAVSVKHPELFGKETSDATEQKTIDICDKVRNDLINEFMDQNKDVSYKEAVLAVSEKRPDLFTMEARTWQ